jgi:hypothetical protein
MVLLQYNVFKHKYRMAQKSVNLKHSLVLMGMFRFKPVIHSVKGHHSVVSCALNTEDLILSNFYKLIK